MTDHPMQFSAPMARATIDLRKKQTRRLLTPHTTLFNGGSWSAFTASQEWDWDAAWVDPGPSPSGNPGPYLKLPWKAGHDCFEGTVHRIYPRIQPGDRIWGREHWKTDRHYDDLSPSEMGGEEPLLYLADNAVQRWGWKPDALLNWGRHRQAMHMPRWASRILLTVTDVRIQRLQEISGKDAMEEGAPCLTCEASLSVGRSACNALGCFEVKGSFRDLWDSLNAHRAPWQSNPFVIAYTFTREVSGGEV